jgi:hypothetical protein
VKVVELKFQIEKFIHAMLAVKDKSEEIVLRFVIERRGRRKSREERGNLFPFFLSSKIISQIEVNVCS